MQRSSTRWRLWTLAVLQAMGSSCSSAPQVNGKPDPDCYFGEVLIDGDCARRCETGGQCATHAGQHCVNEDDAGGYCGCVSDWCGNREDCSSLTGRCVSVACSERVPCESDSHYCDTERRRCYPDNGDCSSEGCQPIPTELADVAAVECGAEDVCTVRRAMSVPLFVDPRYMDPIKVDQPAAGERVSDGEQVAFRWQEIAESALLLVFDVEPSETKKFMDSAVWGAAASAGARPRVDWRSGYAIEKGEWIDATPSPPPPGAYYLLVQAVKGEEVVRLSALIPFLVGNDTKAPWPSPHQSCDTEGSPTQCLHPQIPMVCDGARCRQLCGSDGDCSGGRTCERPDARLNARMCSR